MALLWSKKDTGQLYEQDLGKIMKDLKAESDLAKTANEKAVFLDARSQNFIEACEEVLKITKGALSKAVFDNIHQKLEHFSAQQTALTDFTSKNLNKEDANSGYAFFVRALKVQVMGLLNRGEEITAAKIEGLINAAKARDKDIFKTNVEWINSLEQEANKDLDTCSKTHKTLQDVRTLILRADTESEWTANTVEEVITDFGKILQDINKTKQGMDKLRNDAITDVFTWANKVKAGQKRKIELKIAINKVRQKIGEAKAAASGGKYTPSGARQVEALENQLKKFEKDLEDINAVLQAAGIKIT